MCAGRRQEAEDCSAIPDARRSFWSERTESERFQVEYCGRRWTGYDSLVACLRRALDDGIPITTPRFWRSPLCDDQLLRAVFRSATAEQMPMLETRIDMLREAGAILLEVGDWRAARGPALYAD